MRYLRLALIMLSLFLYGSELIAQKNFGKITSDKPYNQSIEISVYHQYELRLKKGTIALMNITNFNVRTEMTVVNPEGIIVEQVNTAGMADFLIFEATIKGKYQFYIKTLEGEKALGKYTLTAHYLPFKREGKLNQIKQLFQLLEKPDRAGAVVAIVQNGEILFEYSFGNSNVEHSIVNNDQTVFELASVSKQFTGFAIAKLAEQGKLSVEEDIRKYFPELPKYKTPIKIKHLLNHTSGLPESSYPLDLAGFENDPIELERVLNFLQNAPELYFEPGSEFSYSNDGYTLLGELVYRVTKQDFRSWMEKNVFEPLKMNSSIIRDSPEIVIPNRATSYVSYTGDASFRRLSFDFYAPGGCSVRSSLSDLIKWVDYQNQGYHSKEKLFQRIIQVDTLNNGDSSDYSYGNFITDFRGIKRFSHLGLSAGFTTSIARFPERNLGFIYLGNDGEFRNYYLARKIYEIYLEEHFTLRTNKFDGIETFLPTTEEPEDNRESLSNLNLADYEGNYFSQQLNSVYTLQVFRDTLFALSAAYKPIPIIAESRDTFETDEDFMETITFKRDYSGSVSDCSIYNEDDDIGIVFTKISASKNWSKEHHWKSIPFQQRMKDTLEEIESSEILAGFSVAVFNESETFFQEGFGYANIKTEKAYSPETVQLIASISKSITGVSVMKAMELGYFRLDDSINDYLPFKIANPDFPDDEITIRHLLTHTSSLNDTENYDRSYVFRKPLDKNIWPEPYHKFLRVYNSNTKILLTDFLDSIFDPSSSWYSITGMYTKHKPGTNFEYSNLGFALLGYIVEATTKVNFMDFTQKHIFDPLGMTSSTWELEKVDPEKHTSYYLENYKACPYYSINTIPDGGLYTNIIDLTKFLQEAIKGYAGRGKILSQASYAEMFKAQSNLIEIEGGLGWDLSSSCCIGHAGNDFGVATVMYFEPRTGLGRIVFTNTSIDKVGRSFYGIMNLLFAEE